MDEEIEIEFLEWVHPRFGVMPAKMEGGAPLVLKAKIKSPQRTWVGLTIDEKSDCYEKSGGNLSRFAKAIEEKLKEKNK